MDKRDLATLESLLAAHPEASHIRVKAHGDSLVLYSGEGDAQQKHARLTRLGRDIWGISMPANGRWQKTPFIVSFRQACLESAAGCGIVVG